jgi:CRP-like cAMP-binding protein
MTLHRFQGAFRVQTKTTRASAREVLADMPILRGTDARVLDVLAREASFIRFSPSAPVFDRGSEPTGIFFVCSGAVRLMSNCPEGRPKVVEIFEPGGMFGEIGVFTGHRYRTWTQAVGTTLLIHVPRTGLLDAVAVDNALCRRMLTAVCARIQRLIDAISCNSAGTASVRVASYLLDLLDRPERPDAGIVLPAPKKTIASLLNLTPETFSRVLRNLVEEGALAVSGRRIRVRNRAALTAVLASGLGESAESDGGSMPLNCLEPLAGLVHKN